MSTADVASKYRVDVYDTTLRDGAQQRGINLSVADKMAIAPLLDEWGVAYIEGGWPGAIPRDTEFFALAAKELQLENAVLVAFGSTTKAGVPAKEDAQVRALLESEAPVITLVAKSDIRHVERALRTTPEENLRMVRDTVEYLRSHGRRVMVDLEHFFDGFRFDAQYTASVAREAVEAGAEAIVLCDTNGGMLPPLVTRVVTELRERLGGAFAPGQDPEGFPAVLGIHCHNDTECAVANTLAAVDAGCRQAQGTINGYGERTGNANLVSVVGDLELKMDARALPEGNLADSSRIAHAIAEITNIAPQSYQAYVGKGAFAHKAGLHASAIRVDPDLYQHIDPALVGNDMRMVVSDMAGRASIELKGRELGIDLAGQKEILSRVTDRIKAEEARGYTYDAADASFELMLRKEIDGERITYFEVESWRTFLQAGGRACGNAMVRGEADAESEATIKLRTGKGRRVVTGEGNGPVNALDEALRLALMKTYPELEDFELMNYKVRILDSQQGTAATTRVLIDMREVGGRQWSTVGVASNIVEASWEALVDGYVYGLMSAGVAPR